MLEPHIISFLINILTDYGIFLILALGCYVTLMSGQISIGHGAFAGIGAYSTGILSAKLGWPPFISIPIAAVAGGAAGLMIAYLMGLRLKGMYLAIGTFAFGEAMSVVWLNTEYVRGAIGLIGIPIVTDFTLVFSVVAIISFVLWRFEKSHMGRAFRACFDNEYSAAAVGVNARSVKMLAWSLGGAITGTGGALYAHNLSVIRPDQFAFDMSVLVLLAPCIGGYFTFWGTYIGAAVIVFAPWVLNLVDPLDKRIFYALLYVIIMLWRPDGIIGRKGMRMPAILRLLWVRPRPDG